jgi:hypothetical protein
MASSSGSMAGGACAPDPTTNCQGGSTAYSCTGSTVPQDTDPTLVCGMGAGGTGGATLYCCAVPGADAGGTCMQDNSFRCPSGTLAYLCSGGGNTPAFDNPSLLCSDGTAAAGSTRYCCSSIVGSPDGAPCAPDSTVTCAAGSTGFSCAGSAKPDQSDPSISCGSGTVGNTQNTSYCCKHGGAGMEGGTGADSASGGDGGRCGVSDASCD